MGMSGHTCSLGKKEKILRESLGDGNSNMPMPPCFLMMTRNCIVSYNLCLILLHVQAEIYNQRAGGLCCWAPYPVLSCPLASSNSFSRFSCLDSTFSLTAIYIPNTQESKYEKPPQNNIYNIYKQRESERDYFKIKALLPIQWKRVFKMKINMIITSLMNWWLGFHDVMMMIMEKFPLPRWVTGFWFQWWRNNIVGGTNCNTAFIGIDKLCWSQRQFWIKFHYPPFNFWSTRTIRKRSSLLYN